MDAIELWKIEPVMWALTGEKEVDAEVEQLVQFRSSLLEFTNYFQTALALKTPSLQGVAAFQEMSVFLKTLEARFPCGSGIQCGNRLSFFNFVTCK